MFGKDCLLDLIGHVEFQWEFSFFVYIILLYILMIIWHYFHKYVCSTLDWYASFEMYYFCIDGLNLST